MARRGPKPGCKAHNRKEERNAEIVEAIGRGENRRKIAERFGITRARLYQIVALYRATA